MNTAEKSDNIEKDLDVLEQLKRHEKIIKSKLLIKSLTEIKTMAKSILELKSKTEELLKLVVTNPEDIKRVIDFINSTESVQLSKEDVQKSKDWAAQCIAGAKKDIEKKVDDKLSEYFLPYPPGVRNLGTPIMDNHVITTNHNSGSWNDAAVLTISDGTSTELKLNM